MHRQRTGGPPGRLSLRIDRAPAVGIDIGTLAQRIKDEQDRASGGPQSAPVIISARKDVRYDDVIKVMDTLQRGGVVRVGLSVRTTGG